MESQEVEFLVVGAGTAGSMLFYYLSKFSPEKTIIVDKKPEELRFHSAKIIVGHAKQYLHNNFNSINSEAYVRPINSICNSSRNGEAAQYGKKEFGKPYGHVIDEQKFIRWHVNKGVENGAQVVWSHEVTRAKKSNNEWELTLTSVESGKSSSLQVKMLVLATGSQGKALQKSLGFEIPYELNQIVATFRGDRKDIDNCFKTDYFYHMHPKISTHGPFQMTKGDDWFNIIVVSKDSHEEMIETFMRVIKNYDYVQPLFENVTNYPDSFDSNSIRKLKVWKHPVKELVKDGVILLGESTGFVTQCYYEGFLGNFVGAEIASTVLKDIYNSGRSYKKENLCKYQELVKNKLLKNFHLSQKASEDMFLGNREGQFKIWDAYLKALNKHKQVRKNVWLAWTDNKIPDYDLENDEYCGEKIFFSLPLVWRAKLTPFFLKMKFTKN